MSGTKVEIFSARCAKCRILEVQVRRIAAEMSLDADIRVVHDLEEARRRGVGALPALAVDGELLLAGRVPEDEELRSLLRKG